MISFRKKKHLGLLLQSAERLAVHDPVTITLKDRTYICPSCGHVMDRDHQAAVNLREEALRIISENIAQIKRIAA